MKKIIKIIGYSIGGAFILIFLISPFLFFLIAHSAEYAETHVSCIFRNQNAEQKYNLFLSSNVNELSSLPLPFKEPYSLLDQDNNIYRALSKEEFKQQLSNKCKDVEAKITCAYKQANTFKREFMRWGYNKVPDFNVDILHYNCSDFKNVDVIDRNLTESEYLFCVLENVDVQCSKKKRYSRVN